jgi:hypothetical protein
MLIDFLVDGLLILHRWLGVHAPLMCFDAYTTCGEKHGNAEHDQTPSRVAIHGPETGGEASQSQLITLGAVTSST